MRCNPNQSHGKARDRTGGQLRKNMPLWCFVWNNMRVYRDSVKGPLSDFQKAQGFHPRGLWFKTNTLLSFLFFNFYTHFSVITVSCFKSGHITPHYCLHLMCFQFVLYIYVMAFCTKLLYVDLYIIFYVYACLHVPSYVSCLVRIRHKNIFFKLLFYFCFSFSDILLRFMQQQYYFLGFYEKISALKWFTLYSLNVWVYTVLFNGKKVLAVYMELLPDDVFSLSALNQSF